MNALFDLICWAQASLDEWELAVCLNDTLDDMLDEDDAYARHTDACFIRFDVITRWGIPLNRIPGSIFVAEIAIEAGMVAT